MFFPDDERPVPPRSKLFAPTLFAWLLVVGIFGAGLATCAVGG